MKNSVLEQKIMKEYGRQGLEGAGNFKEVGTVSTFNKSGTLKYTLQVVTNNTFYLKL